MSERSSHDVTSSDRPLDGQGVERKEAVEKPDSQTSAVEADHAEEAGRRNAIGTRNASPLRIVLAVALVVVAVGCAYLIWQQVQIYNAQQRMQGAEVPDTPSVDSTSDELIENPIDFVALWEKNTESYAWLYIPGTEVNTPIQQSATDDSFYLTHDQEGNENLVGCAFTQLANKKDFSDPVTVIYGHDTDGVFKTLHYFEDATFFDEHDTFYIYRPGHILTYKIVSAYKYDDRHILNSFDFSKETVREEYFASVQDPNSVLRNVREGVELDADSKIVQFSTCMLDEYHGSSRYIVSGVLVDDQETL